MWLATAAACGDMLPLEERIASTRPLAARVEVVGDAAPPEEAIRAESLPVETIRIVPFIVDDQAPLSPETIEAEVEPVWIACNMQPLQGLFGCISDRLPLKLEDIPNCEPVDPSALSGDLEEFPQPPNPCRLVEGTPAQPQMQVPLDPTFLLGGDLEITMIGHAPDGGDTQVCARAVLEQDGELPTDCIVTTLRAPIGPDAELASLAEMFGLGDVIELPPTPDDAPAPDANPRIGTFDVQVFDGEDFNVGSFEIARGDVIEVVAGHRIEIETETPEDDLQTYLIPLDGDDFEERDELLSGSWFRTWGELLSDESDDRMSRNTWTMIQGEQDEEELPPDGRATLYYVLRDDRQGVDWWWFHVDVVAPE